MINIRLYWTKKILSRDKNECNLILLT